MADKQNPCLHCWLLDTIEAWQGRMRSVGRGDDAQSMDIIVNCMLAAVAEVACMASHIEGVSDDDIVAEIAEIFRKRLRKERIRAAVREKEEATIQ